MKEYNVLYLSKESRYFCLLLFVVLFYITKDSTFFSKNKQNKMSHKLVDKQESINRENIDNKCKGCRNTNRSISKSIDQSENNGNCNNSGFDDIKQHIVHNDHFFKQTDNYHRHAKTKLQVKSLDFQVF